MQPSVKGTLFQNASLEILEALENGTVCRADLESQLKPDEIESIEGEIAISTWYPLETYGRMLKLLAGTSSNPVEWLIESGRRSARRVIEMGVYAQLDDRTKGSWENRIGRILVTLAGSFFSSGKWIWKGMEANAFEIEVLDAVAYSPELSLRTRGFIEVLATRAAGRPIALTHDRSPAGDRIVFRARKPGA